MHSKIIQQVDCGGNYKVTMSLYTGKHCTVSFGSCKHSYCFGTKHNTALLSGSWN